MFLHWKCILTLEEVYSYRVDKNQLWRPYFVKLTSQKGVHTCSVLQVLSTDNMSKNIILEKAIVEKNPNILMPVT